MANIMSMKGVKNKVHKSGFDLTSKIGFTAKVGEILPVSWRFVHPNEKFKVSHASFTRTTPVNTAAFTRIREYYDTFFVPLRLLWDKFPQFVIQTNQPQYAQSLNSPAANFTNHPYMTDADLLNYFANAFNLIKDNNNARDLNNLNIVQQAYKLCDCLGYSGLIAPNLQSYRDNDFSFESVSNVPSTPTALNLFPLAAYHKIYSDYFRFQQWENSKPYQFNFDYVLTNSATHLNISSYRKANGVQYEGSLFELHYANYQKDYNMGQMPNSQFGDVAIAGPVLGNLGFVVPVNLSGVSYPLEARSSSNSPVGVRPVNGAVPRSEQYLSLGGSFNTSGISVLAIRQAVALQKWKEITQASGFDYKSQLRNHWNVNVSDLQSDKCLRIGGYDSQINISEVVNTALNSQSPADIAGKGTSAGRKSFMFRNNTDEYGILMTVYHAIPLLDYDSNAILDRNLLKVSATDYPIPEFDSIGMQETYASELCVRYDSSGLFLQPSGYAPRYAEYKQSRDIVRGGFVHGAAYDDWVSAMSRSFLSNRYSDLGGNIDYITFKVSPSLLNSIFLAQVGFKGGYESVDDLFWATFAFEDDQLICQFLDGVSAVRPFSRNGLPY